MNQLISCEIFVPHDNVKHLLKKGESRRVYSAVQMQYNRIVTVTH